MASSEMCDFFLTEGNVCINVWPWVFQRWRVACELYLWLFWETLCDILWLERWRICVFHATRLLLFPGREELPDPELLVERLLKRRTFRPDPQGTNLMFAFFAQHFTHQFFKTYNRMGLGFTKALDHGVSSFASRRNINLTGNHIMCILSTAERETCGLTE